ncbi:myb dna- containing protein [Fusarium austroafricanum]|uniref:Myb dna- containing protein n=1 Tax=Fusarium austroafricanum TaxID=2364996 RepID=A0A8H4KV42_9HYPO|nr:myb dna- containing protein [Fusarium austroafricanum]
MATIEPRLIHLLNEPTKPQINHTDLPPLHSLAFPTAADRSLPPIDPDTSHRSDRPAAENQSVANAVGSIYLAGDDVAPKRHKEAGSKDGKQAPAPGGFSLRGASGDLDVTEPTNSISRILDDNPEIFDDVSNKKRHRGLHVKDDFVQLPQPLKKQKATQQAPVMPPIINGLHEPPPHAALFPPISSDSFDNQDGSQMKIMPDFAQPPTQSSNQPSQEAEPALNANKSRKRTSKPRRKWTEGETNHLLLGVNRHGVGKWTSILEDTDFKFNDRTAGDLKDRFRTCCPDELRKSHRSLDLESPSRSDREAKQKGKTDVHLEKILIDGNAATAMDAVSTTQQEIYTYPKQKRSRAHRKKMEDLVELGIHGPFKKSHRRERRPFTEQDDTEILEGLEIHGPAWTKIQRDPRFHLSSRQPTDLRDRVRNKYANVYQRIEKGSFPTKEPARGNDVMEPSVRISIENSFAPTKATTLEPQMSQSTSREDLPRWPAHQRIDTCENMGTTQVFEFGETAVPQFMGGEMDISRLLLDDAKLSPANSRFGAEGVPGLSPPTGAPQKVHSKDGMQHLRR